jgi:hypothetical protein
MADSILKDLSGADWPLGFISVPTPGTPVRFTALVDPANDNAPETATVRGGTAGQRSTPTCNQIILQGCKRNVDGTWAVNTGNVFILRRPNTGGGTGAGTGANADFGVMVGVITPGGAYNLPPSGGIPITSLSPYKYYLDATVAGEGAIVVCWGVG